MLGGQAANSAACGAITILQSITANAKSAIERNDDSIFKGFLVLINVLIFVGQFLFFSDEGFLDMSVDCNCDCPQGLAAAGNASAAAL